MSPLDPTMKAAKESVAAKNGAATAAVNTVPVLPPPAPATAGPGPELVVHILRQRWRAIVALGLLLAIVGFAATWFVVPGKYTATAKVHLAPKRSVAHEGETDFTAFAKTQAVVVKSYPVLHRVLSNPEVAELREVRAQSDPYVWLQKELVIDFKAAPEVMTLSLSGDRPEDLARLLNEIAKVYCKEVAAREEAYVESKVKQLEANHQRVSTSLNELRVRLTKKMVDAGIEDPAQVAAKLATLDTQAAAIRSQKVQVQALRVSTEADLKRIKAKLDSPESIEVSPAAVNAELRQEPRMIEEYRQLTKIDEEIGKYQAVAPKSPKIDELRLAYTRQEAAIARIGERYKQDIVVRLRAKAVDDLKQSAEKLETQKEQADKQEALFDTELKKIDGERARLRLQSQGVDQKVDGIDGLRDQIKELETAQALINRDLGMLKNIELPVQSRVSLMEEAQTPTQRGYDRQLKFASLVAAAMFGLAFLGVAFAEYRVRRVYSSDDVAKGTGIPLLGALPAIGVGKGGKTPANMADQAVLNEAVDAVRAQVLHAARTAHVRVILVTSPGVGEGKTTLACHLAASLARASKNTLLIDGDLRNPAIHRQFEVHLEPGFSEALRGEVPFEEVIRPTSLGRLSVVPAGLCDPATIQALGQEALHAHFENLKEQFDFIVIDTSPVLPVADALALGQLADGVVLSVLKNVSRQPALAAAQQRLASLGIRTLGAVVIGENANPFGSSRYPSGPRA